MLLRSSFDWSGTSDVKISLGGTPDTLGSSGESKRSPQGTGRYQTHNLTQGACSPCRAPAYLWVCHMELRGYFIISLGYLAWWTFPAAAEDPASFGTCPEATWRCHSRSSLHVSRHRESPSPPKQRWGATWRYPDRDCMGPPPEPVLG